MTSTPAIVIAHKGFLKSISAAGKAQQEANSILASGQRINSAKDDPFAYYTSQNLQSSANALNYDLQSISKAQSSVKAAIASQKLMLELLDEAEYVVTKASTDIDFTGNAGLSFRNTDTGTTYANGIDGDGKAGSSSTGQTIHDIPNEDVMSAVQLQMTDQFNTIMEKVWEAAEVANYQNLNLLEDDQHNINLTSGRNINVKGFDFEQLKSDLDIPDVATGYYKATTDAFVHRTTSSMDTLATSLRDIRLTDPATYVPTTNQDSSANRLFRANDVIRIIDTKTGDEYGQLEVNNDNVTVEGLIEVLNGGISPFLTGSVAPPFYFEAQLDTDTGRLMLASTRGITIEHYGQERWRQRAYTATAGFGAYPNPYTSNGQINAAYDGNLDFETILADGEPGQLDEAGHQQLVNYQSIFWVGGESLASTNGSRGFFEEDDVNYFANKISELQQEIEQNIAQLDLQNDILAYEANALTTQQDLLFDETALLVDQDTDKIAVEAQAASTSYQLAINSASILSDSHSLILNLF